MFGPEFWIGLLLGAAIMLALNLVFDLWVEGKKLRRHLPPVRFKPTRKAPPVPTVNRVRTKAEGNGNKARIRTAKLRGRRVRRG